MLFKNSVRTSKRTPLTLEDEARLHVI